MFQLVPYDFHLCEVASKSPITLLHRVQFLEKVGHLEIVPLCETLLKIEPKLSCVVNGDGALSYVGSQRATDLGDKCIIACLSGLV